ncbi:MAG: hypothetical protein IPJ98_20795 [Bryobacterales bacterium]|nr:hypothetical protein [Bryobacterales bacterium]
MMRLVMALLLAVPVWARVNYSVAGGDGGAWPRVLESMGVPRAAGEGEVVVVGAGAAGEWRSRVEAGALVILEGASEAAAGFGIVATGKRAQARSVADAGAPELDIIWEEAIEAAVFAVPERARVFAKERWSGAPLVVGWRQGAGAVLWTAVSPGRRGYERFPYLPQALRELGVAPVAESRRLWAFFDASYRSRVDLDFFARRWREAGIGALHVAAWHFWEPDAERDAYLKRLIEACHKRAIHVYAWIEFPHVSQRFWDDHPEWREKTAIGQDAHLDWRRLMNLQNPAAKQAIAAGLRGLAGRFDWDGMNLAELYFESLEGYGNAARFTPMNENARAEFTARHGFDPAELFREGGALHHARNGEGMRKLLEYRASLAHRMQVEWLDELERIRAGKPHLDLVLTHVDDRFDTRMRDLIGADAERLLPVLERREATFLIEDPATVWNLGPERYPEIARRYGPITEKPEKLAIDINIVERYQDVYPTKKQTGGELFQLVHLASGAFERVALYFESSLMGRDLPLLAASGARVVSAERGGAGAANEAAVMKTVAWAGRVEGPARERLTVKVRGSHAVRWNGAAKVDGRVWPVAGGGVVRVPSGRHTVEASAVKPPLAVVDLSAELTSASVEGEAVEFSYEAQARAWVVVDAKPARVEVDGAAFGAQAVAVGDGTWLLELPRGQHVAALYGR